MNFGNTQTGISISTATDVLEKVWKEMGHHAATIESRRGFRAFEVELHRANDMSLAAFLRLKVEQQCSGYLEFGVCVNWPSMEVIRDRLRPPMMSAASVSRRFPICSLIATGDRFQMTATSPHAFSSLDLEAATNLFRTVRDQLRTIARSTSSLCHPQAMTSCLSDPQCRETIEMQPWVVGLVFAAQGRRDRFMDWQREMDVNRPAQIPARVVSDLYRLLQDAEAS